jgi:murein DD-endopeptidase MepM/ murein hydrolase activator NlpD
MTTIKRYKVTDGPIGIRNEADGTRLPARLGHGEEIEVTGEPVEKNGYLWVQHNKGGWSAIGNADGDEVFMLDISNRPADAPRTFRVWAQSISVRESANGKRLPQKLFRPKEVSVDPLSRTEAGGYVWWKHESGWSAECSVNGKEIFMKEVFDAPAAPTAAPIQEALPQYFKGKVHVQLAQAAKVRATPSTDPRGTIIITLKRGKVLEVDMSTLTVADGFYWVKHELGWSALQSTDGKIKFMVEPGTISGLIAIGPEGPKPTDLPGYRALITRLPVAMTDLQWFQYFGNNMWAYTKGKEYGYDRYSQALHGGLDFGNSAKAGIKVYAGIEGEFVKTDYSRKNNTKIMIQNGEYTFIYQHITNARHFSPGQKITPDTILADIEHHTIDNGWDHLHFEVRFMDEWIVNPMLLMTEEVYNEIVTRFVPEKPNENYKKVDSLLNFFYKSATWDKWVTPLDQPMLKLAAPCIGPRFLDTNTTYDSAQMA